MIDSRMLSVLRNVLLVSVVVGSFSSALVIPAAQAADRQKILSATGERGWNKAETQAEYKLTVEAIRERCESWGGEIQAGSDTVVATVPYYFVTAAICNY